MRHIGDLSDRQAAEILTAYLITQDIDAVADNEETHWSIWVRDEDHVPRARASYEHFLDQPDDPRYSHAVEQALQRYRAERVRQQAIKKNMVDVRESWGRANFRRTPLLFVLMGLCILVGIWSGFGQDRDSAPLRQLLFVDNFQSVAWKPDSISNRLINIKQGQVWRIITPIFVHGDLIHLAVNMIMLYILGSQLEMRRGTWTLGCVVLVTAIASNLVQCLLPEEWGGSVGARGISGVVYGLLGYMWVKMQVDPQSGLFIPSGMFVMLVAWMFLGFTGMFESFGLYLANWAHAIGLISGMLLGYVPALRPRTASG